MRLAIPLVILIVSLTHLVALGQNRNNGNRGIFSTLTDFRDSPPENLEDAKTPQINMNVIIVPILAKESRTDELTKLLSRDEKFGEQGTDSEEDEFAGTNDITGRQTVTMDPQPPAHGILPTQPPCRQGQVFDRRLEICVPRKQGSCPLCLRRPRIG